MNCSTSILPAEQVDTNDLRSGGLFSWSKTWLLLLLLIFAFAFQGTRGLYSPDEGRYVNVALNMLSSGDWVHPRLNDDAFHYTKPPLTYWALAASFWAFGENEWGARIPNAFAFFFTTILVYQIARLLVPRSALLAAAIHASSPFVYIAANIVTTDTLLTLWETMAVWAFLQWIRAESVAGIRKWNILMWLAFGLAFMTKGPPGLLPLLPMLAWMVWQKESRRTKKSLFHPLGFLVFLAVGFTWYLVIVVQDHDLLSYFLYDETFLRIFSGKHKRDPEWYGGAKNYVLPLLLGAFPWVLSFWWRLPTYLRKWRSHLAQSEVSLLAFWFLLPLIVFLLAKSKIPLYVLPLSVPISLILARQANSVRPWLLKANWRLPLWLIVLVAFRGSSALLQSEKNAQTLAHEVKKLQPQGFQEVVFLDTSPIYGLRMYLGTNVEEVTVAPGGRHGIENLMEELAEGENGCLFIVKKNDMDELIQALPPLPFTSHEIGNYRDWHFIVLNKKAMPASSAAVPQTFL